MNKKLTIYLVIAILLASIGLALTFNKIGNTYIATFSDGRVFNITNYTYNAAQKNLTLTIKSTDGQGMTMQEMVEARDWLDNQNGRAKQMSKATITINK